MKQSSLNVHQPMQMSDVGKQVIPGSQIPVNTLYKKTIEEFKSEFEDPSIAELHFNHH